MHISATAWIFIIAAVVAVYLGITFRDLIKTDREYNEKSLDHYCGRLSPAEETRFQKLERKMFLHYFILPCIYLVLAITVFIFGFVFIIANALKC
jgi:NADH:ubiquinone oxidoreductase subunit 3 (subunit A)